MLAPALFFGRRWLASRFDDVGRAVLERCFMLVFRAVTPV